MKRLSVICAHQDRPNPGMSAVDLGFRALRERHDLEATVTYYQILPFDDLQSSRGSGMGPESRRRYETPVAYASLAEAWPEVLESDLILYWGDFLHMAYYQAFVAKRLVKRHRSRPSMAAAQSLVRRSYLLEGSPDEVLARTVSFGGTLLFNRAQDLIDPSYGVPFLRFVKGARSIRMRDVYSAAMVASIRGGLAEAALGVDGATLLRREDLVRTSGGEVEGTALAPYANVFFGRSETGSRAFGSFARALCAELSVTPRWLPWLPPRHGFRRRIGGPSWNLRRLRSPTDERDLSPLELIRQLAGARLTITDTYHVSVLSWSLGVPAVCVAEAIPAGDFNVNAGQEFAWRDKRQVFFSTYDAMDYYVYAEELRRRNGAKRRLRHVVELLSNPGHSEHVGRRVAGHAARAEAELVAAIRDATGSAGKARLVPGPRRPLEP